MSASKANVEQINRTLRENLPVLGVVGGMVAWSGATTVAQLGAVSGHPSRLVRVGLLAWSLATFARSGFVVGRLQGFKRYETTEQKNARLDAELARPVTPLRLAACAGEGLALATAASRRFGPVGSVVAGLAGCGAAVGSVYLSRALTPRMRALSDRLEELNAQARV